MSPSDILKFLISQKLNPAPRPSAQNSLRPERKTKRNQRPAIGSDHTASMGAQISLLNGVYRLHHGENRERRQPVKPRPSARADPERNETTHDHENRPNFSRHLVSRIAFYSKKDKGTGQ